MTLNMAWTWYFVGLTFFTFQSPLYDWKEYDWNMGTTSLGYRTNPSKIRCHWDVYKEKLTGNPSLCLAGHDALDGHGWKPYSTFYCKPKWRLHHISRSNRSRPPLLTICFFQLGCSEVNRIGSSWFIYHRFIHFFGIIWFFIPKTTSNNPTIQRSHHPMIRGWSVLGCV